MGGRGGGFRGGGRGGPPRGRGGGAPRGRGGGGRGFKKSGPDDPRISSEVQIFIEGLPPNTQIPELKNFFSGAGEIKMDRLTKQPRIWLYHDKGSQQDCHIDAKLNPLRWLCSQKSCLLRCVLFMFLCFLFEFLSWHWGGRAWSIDFLEFYEPQGTIGFPARIALLINIPKGFSSKMTLEVAKIGLKKNPLSTCFKHMYLLNLMLFAQK